MKLNSRGVTLVEVIIVAGISGFLALTAATILFFFSNHLRSASERTKGRIDLSAAYRILWEDISKAGTSYNVVNILDDTGQPFWDYFPDYPDKLLPVAQRSRSLTLEAGQQTNFIAIVTDELTSPIQYDPAWAYAIGQGSLDTDGSLAYSGINYQDVVRRVSRSLWVEGNLLLLISPILIRPLGSPMSIAPRYSVFLGQVGNDLNLVNPNGVLRMAHPIDGRQINNPDEFLRTLPSAGGGSTVALLQRVMLARYSLQRNPQTNSMNLIREYWVNGDWRQRFTFGTQIARVTLTRKSVSEPMVTFTIEREKSAMSDIQESH